VLRFRAGERDAALADLRRQLSSRSSDPVLVADLVTLLQQAGQSAEAVAIWENAHPATPPDYALAAMVRAYRDQRRPERAEMLARDGLRRFPADPLWPVLLGLVLADAGRGDDALAVLAGPTAARAPMMDRLLAQGYAARRANRPFDAIRHYADAMRRDPANAEARRGMQEILVALRAPWGAAALAAPAASAESMLQEQPASLAADMAAAEVRWGALDRPYDQTHRFDGTDRALSDIDRLLAANPDGTVATQLRFDRIIALRDRARLDEVVAETDRLRADGVALPPYIRHAQADALLSLRRPKEALAGYDAALAVDPADMDAAAGRIYALVEMEDFATAYEAADALVAGQPTWQRYTGDPSLYARSEWLRATLLAGLTRYFGGQPAEAWARIKPERDAAPANADVRLAAGSIMSGREWPRAAEQENRIALSIAPSLVATQVAVAESALARRRYEEARTRIAALASAYPENRAVQRLQRDLAAATGWQFSAEIAPANEHGGGANGGGNELTSAATIASPLIDDLWRITAGYSYADAHPQEGFAYRHRVSTGLSFELPDLAGRFSVHQDLGMISRTGFTASVDWTPTDNWNFAATAERYAAETPLRAMLNGITADALSTRVTYTWDETRSVSLGGNFMPFSDGNRRASADARFRQLLLAVPQFRLIGTAEVYTSVSARSNVPYYSPVADASATIGLLAEHVIWRRYERSLSEVVTLDGGWYGERHFTGGPVGNLSYEHRWRFDPWTELRYGITLGEHMYDGRAARTIGVIVALRQNL